MSRRRDRGRFAGVLLLACLLLPGCGNRERNAGWAVAAGGPNHPAFGGDVGTDLAVAPDGSIYWTGVLTGSAVFGRSLPRTAEIRAASYLGKSIFLARYGSTGALQWAVGVASTGKPDSARVAVLPDGGALVAGQCQGRSVLGTRPGRAIELVCEEASGLFVARYSAAGEPLWATAAAGSAEIALGDLAVLEDGSAYLTGSFSGALVFGAGGPDATALSAPRTGPFSLFLAGVAPDGSLAFAKRWSASGALRGTGIDALEGGPLVVSGSLAGTVAFGPGIGISSAGGQDLFAAAFDRTGDPLWAVRAGGPSDEIGGKIAASDDRTLAILGRDENGSFVTRCDGRGVFLETFRVAGEGFGIAAGAGIAVTGRFFGEAVFGSGGADGTVLQGAGDPWPEDAFVALYRNDGSLAFAVRAGGPEYIADAHRTEAIGDLGTAVAIDPVRHAVYGTGYFYGTATFDLERGKEAAIASSGGFDAFLMRLDI